ncbi:MAG: SRPBCC domain-containing protein [Bacteroidota bacterium]
MAKIIQYQLFFPKPPEVVWEYITNPELIAQWLMPSDIKPVVGHEFQFRTNAMPEMDFDGVFYCKVLEVDPCKMLSYSWKFGPGDGTLNSSIVIWVLTETPNGTELLLVHRGFEGSSFMSMFDSMSEGWPKHIQKILQLINTTNNGSTEA